MIACKKQRLNSKWKIQRLWDDPDEAVEQSLLGMAMIHNGLVVLKGCRAILRRDYNEIDGKVKLISGGSAGNEPAHGGFVGPGMLTAAITGDISVAPATNVIVRVIEELGTDYSPGVLLIVQNFTGYCINFGLAKLRAQNKGINVKMITVKDDVSLRSFNKSAGRRGLTATLFVHKIAGAMADEGKSLNDIYTVCNRIATSGEIATIGVRVPFPGSCGCKEDNDDRIELGCGIHGESGISEIPFVSAENLAKIMLNYLLMNDLNQKEDLQPFLPGSEVAVIINNLGGCTQLENSVLTWEILKQLTSLGFKIQRAYTGSLMTSLNTTGFHVSLLDLSLDSKLIDYLDAPTLAPAWPKTLSLSTLRVQQNGEQELFVPGKYQKIISDDDIPYVESQGPVMNERTRQILLTAITFACEALIACTKQLNIMDEDSGDGDCGTTLARGANAIKTAIKEDRIVGTGPFAIFTQISHLTEKVMGGLQGGLYSLFFDAAAKVFTECREQEPITAHTWLNAFIAANKVISEVGGASIGNRTMLDALIPAQCKLADSLNANMHPIAAFGEAVKTAENCAMQTVNMEASCGRASLMKCKKFKHPDPGAHAIGIWMRAAYEGAKLKLSCQYDMQLLEANKNLVIV